MRYNASYGQKLLAGLILLTTCTTILALSTNRERRRIGIEESSHRPARTETAGSRSLKLSSNKNNAITTEPGRKVSHRLIGGHLKVDTKEEREESLWDDGILMSSAGNGKEAGKTRGEDDDEKKTLSQQVKEGKYGLIQNEIYKDPPKRPGIISYLGNPEVPKDTSKNLGGLDEDEIWLAENHVLVLRGGKFPARDTAQGSGDGASVWPPIDDYKAPRRQVKIPARPKVPPPFPVQLKDGGPIQIIGLNGTKEIENGTIDYKDSFYTKELLEGDGPLLAIISNGTIISPDFDNIRNLTGDGLPLNDEEKKTKSGRPSLNGPPTFYHAIPPGAVFVPPPTNLSDYDDEDQSIYYPPPYSFKYHQDNTTAVPPGPLVPGIILPPPPDFFSPLEEKKPTTTKKYSKRPSTTTPPPRPRPTYLPPRKLTTKQFKTSTVSSVATKTSAVPSTTTKLYRRPAYKNFPSTVPPKPIKTVPYVEVSTIVPDKPTTLDTTEFYTVSPIVGNQVSDTNKQGKSGTWPEMSSKTIPVLTYYPTTTPSTLEKPIVVTPASIKNIITTTAPDKSPNQASYYFYEESNNENAGVTADPTAFRLQTTTESPTYFETRSQQDEAKKEYYSVETIPSQQTAKDYSIKFIDSLVKNSQMVQYNEPGVAQTTSKFDNSGTRAQNQRMLPDNTAIYYPSVPARPIPEVEPYYSNPTTPKPINRYRQEPRPKAIYQYSFQAADYSKRGGSQKYSYSPPEQSTVYNSYEDLKGNRHQYVYEDSTPTPEEYRSESEAYGTQQRPVYPQPTDRNLLNTTPNPQHAYFTQQEEKLLDDVTKEYFTIFGKKISGGRGLPSTTPIYGKSSSVTERPNYSANPYVQNNYNTAEAPIYKTPNVKVHYGDQSQRQYSLKDDTLVNYKQPLPPINPDSEFITKADQKSPPLYSLKGDTLVNYRPPLPPINPDSEFITIVDPKTPRPYTLIDDILVKLRQPLPQQQQQQHGNGQPSYAPRDSSPEEIDESYASRPYTLDHDIDVNYRDPRPTINPDAEFIEPVRTRHTEKPNSYIAYKLPGDSGHFYFLTPRAITPRPEQSRSSRYPKWRYRDDFFPRGLRQRRS